MLSLFLSPSRVVCTIFPTRERSERNNVMMHDMYFLPFHLELLISRCILMTGSRETDEFAM